MSKEQMQTSNSENTPIIKNPGQSGGKVRPVAKIQGHKDGMSNQHEGAGGKCC